MNYSEFHNHKWALNLAHANQLFQQREYDKLYRGEDLPDKDVFPGLRVMAAYWVSVEHEMPLRWRTLIKGSGHPEWEKDPALLERSDAYLTRFLDDMCELVIRSGIAAPERIEQIVSGGLDTPPDWAAAMHNWQEQSAAALEAGDFPPELFEIWVNSCLRSVANYNRYLIRGAVAAAALYKEGGPQALQAAVDTTAEEFMWEISRVFYNTVLPAAGFEDIGDLMELGMRGMFADQWYESKPEQQVGEAAVRQSILKNCELAGIFRSVAVWEGLPELSLGYGICRYCEAHGLATMMISLPPMVSPSYRRVQSLGMDGQPCIFELTTTPADDMERLLMVQEKVFGPVE